ncbi:MAG: ADP-ribosylglycohydrolase family protein [Myxococcota bacterium]
MEIPAITRMALLGQAVGDAFGAPFEYNRFARAMAMRSLAEGRYLDAVADVGQKSRWARLPGLYTDDTQQALALLRACHRADDFLDGHQVADHFMKIVIEMHDAYVPGAHFGVHRGTGRNFRESVRRGQAVHTAGLGAAMRIGPAATLIPELGQVLPWAVQVSRSTTTHPIALTCAAIFGAYCHAAAIQREDGLVERILEWLDTPEANELRIEREAWLEPLRAAAVLDAMGEAELLAYAQASGHSNKTLDCAANGFALTGTPWVLHHAREGALTDALFGVCASGGDADTVCAMVGCLTILRLGERSVPRWMLDGLIGAEYVRDPMSWDPIDAEAPLTQREESLRRQALLEERAQKKASLLEDSPWDFLFADDGEDGDDPLSGALDGPQEQLSLFTPDSSDNTP